MRIVIVLKRSLSLCFLMAAFQTFAQGVETISAGTKFLGGNLSLYNSNRTTDWGSTTSESNHTSISIGPSYGKYVKDNLAWGSSIYYSYSKDHYSSSGATVTGSGGGFDIFITRNYKLTSNFFFELEPRFNVGLSKQTSGSDTGEVTHNYISAGVGVAPGLLFFLGNRFGLRTSLGYAGYSFSRGSRKDSEDVTSSNSVIVRAGLTDIFFSLRYYIPTGN